MEKTKFRCNGALLNSSIQKPIKKGDLEFETSLCYI